jgi:VWFA-related protein
MKLKLPQSILILTVICVISNFSILAQPTLKEQNRIKDFGKSLKKYEKKNEKETDKSALKDDETIRVETNLVVNDVLVVNQKGNLIAGLKKEDFIITENSKTQEIGLFAFGEDAKVPRSIVLIIDYSTSLLPYIENSIEATKLLVDKLGENDRMAIVTDDVELLVDFTKDKLLLKQTLDVLKKNTLKIRGGKSRQYSALLAVLNELFDEEDVRPMIIFQTDGDELPLLAEEANPLLRNIPKTNLEKLRSAYGSRKFKYSQIKTEVEKARATIYSIIPGIRFLGMSEEEKLKRGEINVANMLRNNFKEKDEKYISSFSKENAEITALEFSALQSSVFEVANLSGGYTDFIEKPEDAETVYNTIFQTIANRYVIGYYPKNETKDGKRRAVKIEVKNHPEYIIMGRKSYIAPLEEK